MKTTFCLSLSIAALTVSALHPCAVAQTASKLTTVYRFSARDSSSKNADGALPESGVILGNDGNLYGTTILGGVHGLGTAFRLTPGGKLTTFYVFPEGTGDNPYARLIQGSDSNFYGTTAVGAGGSGRGAVFRISLSGTTTNLHNFVGLSSFNKNEGGADVYADLIQASDGNFYGTTLRGGHSGSGVVFRITPGGDFTVVWNNPSVRKASDNGSEAAVIQGSDGNLYGATAQYLFKLTLNGMVTQLASASYARTLTEGLDGNFYGVDQTRAFRMTPAGELTVLHTFSGTEADGHPFSRLLLASDGNFYGTSYGTTGDGQHVGIVYALTPDGTLTTVYKAIDNADGAYPYGDLCQVGDGSFYGVSASGGNGYDPSIANSGSGTVFHLVVSPAVTSADTASGVVGQPFSYQITGSLNPKSFGVLGLPPGLKVDAKTGLIFGTPTTAGTRTLTLKAVNAGGAGQAALTLTVAPGYPAITSATTDSTTVGQTYSYQITASNGPTRYGVLGLPPGLHVDGGTGLISGTPTGAPGTKSLTLKAANSFGTGQATLALTIQPN